MLALKHSENLTQRLGLARQPLSHRNVGRQLAGGDHRPDLRAPGSVGGQNDYGERAGSALA